MAELYSTEVAKAKNEYLVKQVQWQHDLKLKNLRKKLFEDKAISEQLWVDSVNDEQRSQLDFQLAGDHLSFFLGLNKEEIQAVKDESGDRKSRCILRSPIDGTVIHVYAQIQDLADPKTALMEIAISKP